MSGVKFLIPTSSLKHNHKSDSKRKRRRLDDDDDVKMCKDGEFDHLHKIYIKRAIGLNGSEIIVSNRNFYGCSQCAREGLKGVCGCNRGFCSVCEDMCFVCRRIQHVSSLSKSDADFVVTNTLREVLMQACTLARAKEPNEVLLENLASRLVQAKFCLNLLNKMRSA